MIVVTMPKKKKNKHQKNICIIGDYGLVVKKLGTKSTNVASLFSYLLYYWDKWTAVIIPVLYTLVYNTLSSFALRMST